MTTGKETAMMNRNTKRHGRRAASMLASVLGLVSAFGADLVVPREGLAPTASATYDMIVAHGDLTVGAGVTLTATAFKLAPDPGDCATVTIRDGGRLKITGTGSTYGENGGGTGFFDVRSPGSTASTAALYMNGLRISADAVTGTMAMTSIKAMSITRTERVFFIAQHPFIPASLQKIQYITHYPIITQRT